MITKIKFKSSFRYMCFRVKHLVSGYTGTLEITVKNNIDSFMGGKLKIENFTFNGGGQSPFRELDIPPMELNQQKKFKTPCDPLPSLLKPSYNAKLLIVLRNKENMHIESKNITIRFLDEEQARKEIQNKLALIITIIILLISAITFIKTILVPLLLKIL